MSVSIFCHINQEKYNMTFSILCFKLILPVKFKTSFYEELTMCERRLVSMLVKQRSEIYWSLHRKCFSWIFFHEFSKVLILQICHHFVQSINLWKQMIHISQWQLKKKITVRLLKLDHLPKKLTNQNINWEQRTVRFSWQQVTVYFTWN